MNNFCSYYSLNFSPYQINYFPSYKQALLFYIKFIIGIKFDKKKRRGEKQLYIQNVYAKPK